MCSQGESVTLVDILFILRILRTPKYLTPSTPTRRGPRLNCISPAGFAAAWFDPPTPLQIATTPTHPCWGCCFVRPGRIELPTDPWQGPVIPLNHGRNYKVFSASSVQRRSLRFSIVLTIIVFPTPKCNVGF